MGTSTVGSGTNPIYLSSGSPTASSSTVGSTTTPVYLNSGTITGCTINSTYGGVLISRAADGVCEMGKYFDFHTSSDSTADYDERLTADATSFTISGGTTTGRLVAATSGSATGGSTTPCYINSSGKATACTAEMPISGSTFTGIAYAQTNTSYTTYQIRNIAFTTSTPSSLTNGNVCMVYS